MTVPPPVAKSAPVNAVLNSARVPVIQTIEVWSHVLVQEVEPAPIVFPL